MVGALPVGAEKGKMEIVASAAGKENNRRGRTFTRRKTENWKRRCLQPLEVVEDDVLLRLPGLRVLLEGDAAREVLGLPGHLLRLRDLS